MSWQVNHKSFVILHVDHTSFSNVFVFHLPESSRILIVILHQKLSVKWLVLRLYVSHIPWSDASENENSMSDTQHILSGLNSTPRHLPKAHWELFSQCFCCPGHRICSINAYWLIALRHLFNVTFWKAMRRAYKNSMCMWGTYTFNGTQNSWIGLERWENIKWVKNTQEWWSVVQGFRLCLYWKAKAYFSKAVLSGRMVGAMCWWWECVHAAFDPGLLIYPEAFLLFSLALGTSSACMGES